MPITTDNEKLAVMEWGNPWEPALPLSPGTLGQDDQQQLLWGFPGVLWGAPPIVRQELIFFDALLLRVLPMDSEILRVADEESVVTRESESNASVTREVQQDVKLL